MRVVVLGAGSFAGQSLLRLLVTRGDEILAINRSAPQDFHQWPWIEGIDLEKICKWKSLNLINDTEEISNQIRNFRPKYIIDLMGQSMVAPS